MVWLGRPGVELGLPDAWDVGRLRGHRPAAHLARDGGEGWPVALGPAHCRHDGLAAHGVVDIFGPGAGGEGNRPPDVLSVSDLLPLSFLQSQTRLSLTSFRCRLGTGRNDQRFGLYRGEDECVSSCGFRGQMCLTVTRGVGVGQNGISRIGLVGPGEIP